MVKLLQNLLFVIICTCVYNVSVYAQKSDSLINSIASLPRPTNTATLVGFGSSNLYDTYLSPLEYKGISARVMHERMKQTSWFNNKFPRQQIIEVEVAMAENPAKNAKEYWLLFDFYWGGHYNLIKTHNFRFSAGGLLSASLGALYNERNTNNPASARAYANFNLSAIAFYYLKPVTLRWQIDSPVVGVLFSPHFGQSYYEMSLGNTVGTANFASLHNQRALRNYITADIPINNMAFRVGYMGSLYQTKVNDLQTHTYTHSIVLGLVFESIRLGGNKVRDNKLIKSSYYFY